jgi:hypothetical protein
LKRANILHHCLNIRQPRRNDGGISLDGTQAYLGAEVEITCVVDERFD